MDAWSWLQAAGISRQEACETDTGHAIYNGSRSPGMVLCQVRPPSADQAVQRGGTAAPSFTATLLEEAVSEGKLTAEHAEDIKGAAGVIYTGTYDCICLRH